MDSNVLEQMMTRLSASLITKQNKTKTQTLEVSILGKIFIKLCRCFSWLVNNELKKSFTYPILITPKLLQLPTRLFNTPNRELGAVTCLTRSKRCRN